MLTHHSKSVSLSLVSVDLPVWSVVRATATLYQKDQDRFHVLFTEPKLPESRLKPGVEQLELQPDRYLSTQITDNPRLLWLEVSPYRVIMTMQGNGKFSYRHFWEQGVYGLSRYWLQSDVSGNYAGQLRLRNFTRSLLLQGKDFPRNLRVEYELWSEKVQLGCYILNLEVLD